MKGKDVTGQTFGRLTVSSFVGSDKKGNALWRCKCSCGGETTTRGFMLRSGRAKSCGCWHSEEMIQRQTKPRIAVSAKRCPTCRIDKPAELFASDDTRPDGLSSQCKKCRNVEYKRRNMPKIVEATSARKRQIKLATPQWAPMDRIKEIYVASIAKSKETGVRHHVDHILPIKGKTVSGLHVPWNLQVIPWRENLTKGNGVASK